MRSERRKRPPPRREHQTEEGRHSDREDKPESEGSETEGEPGTEPKAEDTRGGGSRSGEAAPAAVETTNSTVITATASLQPAEASDVPASGRSGTRSLSLKKRKRASFVDPEEVAVDDALSQELMCHPASK